MKENSVENQLAKVQDHPEKHWLKIALFSLLGLALIGGLIFAAIKIGVPNKPWERACTEEAKICPDGSAVGRMGPNCEFAPCPTQAIADETANWKTYSNEEYNFEFEYPSNWVLIRRVNTPKDWALSSENNLFGINLSVIDSNNKLNGREYIESIKNKAAGDIIFSTSGYGDFEPKEEIPVTKVYNSLNWSIFTFTYLKPKDLPFNKEAWAYTVSSGKLVQFVLKDNEVHTLFQILSTFKFLDQSQTDETTKLEDVHWRN